jgi:hypothetical protein
VHVSRSGWSDVTSLSWHFICWFPIILQLAFDCLNFKICHLSLDWLSIDNIRYLCNQCLSPMMLWVRISIRGGVQQYVIKFVSDLRQVSGFLRVLWFPNRLWKNYPRICCAVMLQRSGPSSMKYLQINKKKLKSWCVKDDVLRCLGCSIISLCKVSYFIITCIYIFFNNKWCDYWGWVCNMHIWKGDHLRHVPSKFV